MKKFLVVFAALLMACTLVGCAKENKEATSFEDQLISSKKIIVGISPDYPPFENLTTDGEIEGFDKDFIDFIVKELGEDFSVEFAKIEFDNIVSALQAGQVDIGCSGFTYDPDRDVIFSTPYTESAQAVLVAKDSGIESLKDLAGKKVGAQTGATGYDCALEIEGTDEVISFVDSMIGISSVGKNIDAYVGDYGVVKAYANANDMVVLSETLAEEEMSVIIKKGNDLLADKINECIEKFIQSEDYEALKLKWGI